jgi:hypothetical protein
MDARACGVFLATTSNGSVEATQTLVVVRKDKLEIHARIAAATGQAGFAWVLPVPGDPTVALGDAKVFEDLAFTQPHLSFPSAAGRGGCGGFGATVGMKSAAGGSNGQDVTVLEGGKLGGYQYSVLEGSSSAGVVAWAKDNGYTVPDGLEAALSPYAEAGMRFVVAQLDPASADPRGYVLDPLVVTLARPADGTWTYPLALMKLSETTLSSVLFFVLADKRYRVSNYGGMELDAFANEIGKRGEGAEYDEVLDEVTAAGDGRLFITELAEDLRDGYAPQSLADLMDSDAFYLTRLYARVPHEAVTDATVTYATQAGEVSNYATATTGGSASAGWLLLLAIGLGTIAGRRRAPA